VGEGLGGFPCDCVGAGGVSVLEPSPSVGEAGVVDAVDGIAVLATDDALALERSELASGSRPPISIPSGKT
jgi:hypothetical protein